MAILKTISLFCVCFALFVGNVANASMPCCITDIEQPGAEMQMDGDIDIPCHEIADSDSKDTTSCNGCDCQHCLKMTVLPRQTAVQSKIAPSVKVFGIQSVNSRQPEGIFQPPKYNS